MANERRAYWCVKCDETVRHRVFLTPGEEIPKCQTNTAHGKLKRQTNKPYADRRNEVGPVGSPRRT